MGNKPTYEELEQRIEELEREVSEHLGLEEKIKAERKRLYSIFNLFPGLIYLQAPDYSIRFANRRFIEQYGEPKGRLCYEAIWNRKEPCENCPTFKVFDTKEPEVWESKHPTDGSAYLVFDYPFVDIDGSLLVLEISLDISERKMVEEERELLITELQEALSENKILRGILPICSYCKKIRDGEDKWHQLEVYIKEHSGALFSHGICEDCEKNLLAEAEKSRDGVGLD